MKGSRFQYSHNFIQCLLELVLPRRCAVCGCVLQSEESYLCLDCTADLPLTYYWLQERNPMADKLNWRIEQAIQDEGAPFEAYSRACALYFYKEKFRSLTRGVKYSARRSLGRYLGKMLGEQLLQPRQGGAESLFVDVDMVLPVPLHWTRFLTRGYNQAEIIARSLAATLGCPCRTDILRRSRRTKSQARLEVSQKASNVSGAFSVNSLSLPDTAPSHILLLDDVFTTGSTLTECHRALRRALTQKYGPGISSQVRISISTVTVVGD